MSSTSNRGEVDAEPYFAKLLEVLGVKGVVLLALLVAVTALGSAWPTVEAGIPGLESLAVTGGLVVTLALGFAVALDQVLWPETGFDFVGGVMVLIAAAFTVMASLGFVPGWQFALFSSFFLFAAVVGDYFYNRQPGLKFGEGRATTDDVDELMNLDVVGFVFSELLLVYAIVVYAGWSSFAHHPVFPALAFVLISGFFAVVAGYRVIRETVVVRPDEDFNEILVGLLRETRDVEDAVLRRDIAAKLRDMAESLDGVSIPTNVRDKYGGVPVVLPEDAPDHVVENSEVDRVLQRASDRRHTGYVLHGEDVHVTRNGTQVASFVGGEYTDEDQGGRKADGRMYETTHGVVNQLESVIPEKRSEAMAPEPLSEREAAMQEESEKTAEEDQVIQVGGQEVDLDDMFQRADDIIDDLSKRGGP